jgi:hypothetical protein
MYKIVVMLCCLSVVFTGWLLLAERADSFAGYELICRTPTN